MIYVKRRASFSASHRLFNPSFSDDKNEAIFDKCNNPYGHGHNYLLDVTVCGLPDPETGYVIDLKLLADLIKSNIVDLVDHKHLNYDVDFLRGVIPTVENLVVLFWQQIVGKLPSGELFEMNLSETDNNSASYRGEPVTIVRHDLSGISVGRSK